MHLTIILVLFTCIGSSFTQTCEERLDDLKKKVECYQHETEAKLSRYCDDQFPLTKLKSRKRSNFTIYPTGVNCKQGRMNGLDVSCDQVTEGGGWIVFQRRRVYRSTYNGTKLIFFRDWKDFKHGFGRLDDEFWLGLQKLHRITRTAEFELRVDLKSFGKRRPSYAKYAHFSVGEASTNYRLSVSGYTGNAGDSLSYHDGKMFSTFDRDNDGRDDINCAELNWGGWWYSDGDQDCLRSNLNGRFHRWYKTPAIRNIEMKIRRRNRSL